jgi:hypothetical protein
MDAQDDTPSFNRQPFKKEVYQKKPRIVHDDVWTFNTQSSTQWDGFRHFGYQKEEVFYNGATVGDIEKGNVLGIGGMFSFLLSFDTVDSETNILYEAWSERGLVTRGILIDLPLYYAKHNIKQHNPFSDYSIPLSDLKAALESQGVIPRFGDMLLIRSGFMKVRGTKTPEELVAVAKRLPAAWAGVEQSEEVLKWIWENFGAVAADHPSFECWRT